MSLRAAKKDQTRTNLIQTGMRLFTQESFGTTTIDQITTAAGVGKGTFYNYFKTKEDLLVAGMQLAQDADAERMRAEVFQLPATLGRLQRTVRWAVDWVTGHPELAMVWCEERLRRGLAHTASGFDLLLTEVLAAGQASGALRADRTAETMTLEVEGLILSYVAAWYHGGRAPDLGGGLDGALEAYITGARRQLP